MYNQIRKLTILANIIIIFILIAGHLMTPYVGVLSNTSIFLIILQAFASIVALKYRCNRLILFYVFIFTMYFLQNYIFMIQTNPIIDLLGEYYSLTVNNQHTFERTVVFIGTCHLIFLSIFSFMTHKNEELKLPKFENLNGIILLMGLATFVLIVEFIAIKTTYSKLSTYFFLYFKAFFLSTFNIFLIAITLFIDRWKFLKVSHKVILISMSLVMIIVSTMGGARSAVAFFILLFFINILNGNIKIKPKKIHVLIPLLIFPILVAQYQLGTIFRYKNSVNAQVPSVGYQIKRLSSRLSGINYVHLFVNYSDPKKAEIIENELIMSKRVKAGMDRFIKAKVFEETSMALLFEYFFRQGYHSEKASLDVYNSDMVTFFGEAYFYTKSFMFAFTLIALVAFIIAKIYNSIQSLLILTFFLFQFHDFFISFGIPDWYLPDLLCSITSFILIMIFLKNFSGYKIPKKIFVSSR